MITASHNTYEDNGLKIFDKTSLNTSNSLTLSIDINNILITSFNYDSNIKLEEYVEWYKNKILNPYILDNFDIYFYPLNNKENSIMVICINNEIKNIMEGRQVTKK